MLISLLKHGKKVLITIDEVVNNSAIKVFAHSFQMLVRKDLPIFLLMTGLYENIYNLQNEKSLTFLYRAPKIKMNPLNTMRISENYQATLNVAPETALKMAKITKGYSYAFQVLGFLVWKKQGYHDSIMPEYLQYLEEYVYEKLWSELSMKDKELLFALARSETGKVQDIQNILGIQHNQFTPYQKRLLQKGIIESKTHGYIDFALPMFREYVEENSI